MVLSNVAIHFFKALLILFFNSLDFVYNSLPHTSVDSCSRDRLRVVLGKVKPDVTLFEVMVVDSDLSYKLEASFSHSVHDVPG